MNTVMKCHLCGELYEFYSHIVGDQSVCPTCRTEAADNMKKRAKPWKPPSG